MQKNIFAMSMLFLSIIILSACSDNDEGTAVESDKLKVSLDSITGYSQKGTFVKGSDVLLYELENGQTLKQTSHSYAGKIISDDGRFRINADISSRYVYLQVKGYFHSELVGDISSGTLSLETVADVSKGNQVNINLLTHLEYNRVLYLVTKEHKDFATAKKTAQRNVFNVFHIDATDFDNSENLELGGKSKADAALIAVSAILLSNAIYNKDDKSYNISNEDEERDCGAATLTERLMRISTDIETDSVYNNDSLITVLADIVEQFHHKKEIMIGIRRKLENWGYGKEQDIPYYEKYLNQFWATEYGLGICDSTTVGSTMQNQNPHSVKNGNKFTCVAPRKNIDWNDYFGWDGYYGYYWLDCNQMHDERGDYNPCPSN